MRIVRAHPSAQSRAGRGDGEHGWEGAAAVAAYDCQCRRSVCRLGRRRPAWPAPRQGPGSGCCAGCSSAGSRAGIRARSRPSPRPARSKKKPPQTRGQMNSEAAKLCAPQRRAREDPHAAYPPHRFRNEAVLTPPGRWRSTGATYFYKRLRPRCRVAAKSARRCLSRLAETQRQHFDAPDFNGNHLSGKYGVDDLLGFAEVWLAAGISLSKSGP